MTVASTTNKLAATNPVGYSVEIWMMLKRAPDGAITTYSSSLSNLAPPNGSRVDRGTITWPIPAGGYPPDYPQSTCSLTYSGETITGTFTSAHWVSIWDKTVVRDA